MRTLYDRDHIRFAVFALICLLGAAPQAAASGLTITVNSTAQPRQPPGVGCTITEAIELTGLWASAPEPGVQVVGLGEPALGNCTVEFDAAADGMTIVVPAGEYVLTSPYANTDSAFPLIGPVSYPFYGVPWGVGITGDAAGGTIITRDSDPSTPKFRLFHVQTWLKLEHLTLSGGDAGTGVGGAIYGDDSHVVCGSGESGPCRLPITLRHITFENNSAVTGGALGSMERMYLEGVEFRIEDSTFRGNHATEGGAISVPQTGWTSIARSRFEENVAVELGGAIDSYASLPIEISDTTFLANRALNQSGGAISARFARISRAILRDNSAGGGGALFSAGGRPVVIDTAFTTNSAQYGGAIQIQSGSVEIRGSTFDRNVATQGDGGGLQFQADALSSLLSNSTFSGNTAVGRGGAAFVYSGKLSMNNVTITGNRSGNNGPGLALRLWSESTVEIANSIVAGNSTTLGEFIDVSVGPAEHLTSFGYNIFGSDRDMTGWSMGPGDRVGTDAAPLESGLLPLADNGGPTLTHAHSENSPARDGGNTAAPGSEGACETTDQRGHPRPGPGSARCDSGAFESGELAEAGTATTLTSSANPSVDGQSVRFTATIVASDPGAGIPGGSVQFLNVTAGTTIDLVALDGTGVANVDVPFAAGSYQIKALYPGDSNFTGSESTITQVVTTLDNAAPVNTIPGSQTISQGETLIFTSANRIGVADEDDSDNAILGDEVVQVMLSAADGSLTLSSVTGLNFSTGGNGARSMTFSGTIADVNYGLNGLSYTPPMSFSGLDTLTIATSDLGNFGAGTALIDSDTVSITVTPKYNDAPRNTVPGSQSVVAGSTLIFTAANRIGVADVDDADNGVIGDETVQVTLTATHGALTLSSVSGLTFNAGSNGASAMAFTGTLADINNGLGSLAYTPSTNFAGVDTLTIATSDLGNFGAGTALTDSDTVGITVSSTNDAPVNTVPGPHAVNTGATLIFSAADRISVADPDDADNAVTGDETVEVSLIAADGVVTLSSTIGLNFSAGSNGARSMTFSGTLFDINSALDGLSYAPLATFSGLTVLAIVTNDMGNFGGAPLTDTDAVAIMVSLGNDPPVNAVPGPQALHVGTTLIFNSANPISIADVDDADNGIAGDEIVRVTLIATHAALTLNDTAGLIFSAGGNGGAAMTFTGPLAAINSALNGLRFAPTVGFSGSASLSISTNDLGNFGEGGELTDTDTVQITVATVLQTLTIDVGVAGRVVDAANGIDCIGSCSVALPSGTTVTLSAQPLVPGAVFMNWGGNCQGLAACVVVVDTARTVSATFGYPVSARAAGPAGMKMFSISPAFGPETCFDGCTWTVPAGSTVTVTALALPPLQFVRWLSPNPCSDPAAQQCQFTVNSPIAATAKLANAQGAPVARITGPSTLTTASAATQATATFDGSTSSDPNGNGNAGLTYRWSIDGQPVAGSIFTAPYLLNASLSAGSHLISLTVTDVEEVTGTTTKTVSVTVPPPHPPFPILNLPASLVLEATHGFEVQLPSGTVTATNNDGVPIGFDCWTRVDFFGHRSMILTLGVQTVKCEASVPWVLVPVTRRGTFTVTVTAPLALSKAQALLANAQQTTGATNAMKTTASKAVTAIETAHPNAVCPALNNFVDAVNTARQQNKITANVMVAFIAQAADFGFVAACVP